MAKMGYNFKFLLVVTYGRSGSTLLQGLLNELPNVLLRGENNGAIYNLVNSYSLLKKAHQKFISIGQLSTDAWFGLSEWDLDNYAADVTAMIERLLFGAQDRNEFECIGFKEIRYLYNLDNNRDIYEIFSQLFKPAGIIFLFRNQDDVLKSGWWATFSKDKKEIIRSKINSFESDSRAYNEEHPDSSFIIRYEDIIARNENLESLFRFLGTELDEDLVEIVLARKHSA